jgi:hypothetical protein
VSSPSRVDVAIVAAKGNETFVCGQKITVTVAITVAITVTITVIQAVTTVARNQEKLFESAP